MSRRQFLSGLAATLLTTVDAPDLKVISGDLSHLKVEWSFIFRSTMGPESMKEFLLSRAKFEKINSFMEINQKFIASGDLLSLSSDHEDEVFTQKYVFKNINSANSWKHAILEARAKESGLINLEVIEDTFGITVNFKEKIAS